METNKLLSSLCYFSIFFAGFIFPIAVYFISGDDVVKGHAKSALLSHLIPLLTIPIVIVVALSGVFAPHGLAIGLGAFMVLGIIVLNIGVVIWNIVKGILVLKN